MVGGCRPFLLSIQPCKRSTTPFSNHVSERSGTGIQTYPEAFAAGVDKRADTAVRLRDVLTGQSEGHQIRGWLEKEKTEARWSQGHTSPAPPRLLG
jgi:hypothetical protein